ncbi:hypothetical protein OBBRIDRAFT_800090 [Obba rivulosa]|uniref:Uncharacterized protein n=1 Tax=Obba rivulosa TaxID=1052685 RepID=A0A8E2DV17_9APHY|nr:hypothetical protein OBBRIDRAFT_800090 [Obba rivulosa]
MSRSLRKLVEEPFGPYADCDILTADLLCLEDLQLECRGKPTGLTECEPCQPEYHKGPLKHGDIEVRFRGVLEIENFAWLTHDAREVLQNDLRSISPYHTLQSLYGKNGTMTGGSGIKVLVQGTKAMAALFLSSKLVPNGLILFSKDRNRCYEVSSMCIETYELSRVVYMVALDKKMRRSKNLAATDVPLRTPDWFVQLYKSYLANDATQVARTRRIMPPSSDSDTMPGTQDRLRNGRKRTLPHISTAEVMSLLTSQAEWLVSNQRKRIRDRFFNVDVWTEWLPSVKQARREAAQNGVTWGGFNPDEPDDGSGRSGEAEDINVPRPRRRVTKRKRPVGPPLQSGSAKKRYARQRYPSSDDMEDAYGRIYDPDFSPPSTPAASSSEESLPSQASTPTDPALLAHIPSALMEPPPLPTSYVWVCPLHHCSYRIDLKRLTNENGKGLLEHDKQRLSAGGWNLNEPWVHDCFLQMVSVHYRWHEEQLGIETTWEGNRPKLLWKNPERHTTQHRPRRKKPQPAMIKQED